MKKFERFFFALIAFFTGFGATQAFAQDDFAFFAPQARLLDIPDCESVAPRASSAPLLPVPHAQSDAVNSATHAAVKASSAQYERVSRHPQDETRQSSGTLIIVDRLDGDDVVLDTEAGPVRFPRQALPTGADHEGAVIHWHHDANHEQNRLSGARARIERMKAMSR